MCGSSANEGEIADSEEHVEEEGCLVVERSAVLQDVLLLARHALDVLACFCS
jgi:hypothetical protein